MTDAPLRAASPGKEDSFDPGATLYGHAPRAQRSHYLGGGLWVCFECLAKLLVGGRRTAT